MLVSVVDASANTSATIVRALIDARFTLASGRGWAGRPSEPRRDRGAAARLARARRELSAVRSRRGSTAALDRHGGPPVGEPRRRADLGRRGHGDPRAP